MERHGYVGLFAAELNRERISELVMLWMSRFGTVEQVAGKQGQALTLSIRSEEDIMWEKDLQFRVCSGEQFSWVYITLDRRIIETTGLSQENTRDLLCRDILDNLSDCDEIIDDRDDRRLDELEKQGLM